MFRSLAKKWENFQFEAMIKHRVELTRKMLKEHGAPTEPEVHLICEMYAKVLVKRNLGRFEEGSIKETTEEVKKARVSSTGECNILHLSQNWAFTHGNDEGARVLSFTKARALA